MKTGLALGSGGVRGFAHFGVLEVLEREGLMVDVITGASVGATLGAMYAFRPKLAPNLTHMQNYLHSEIYDHAKIKYLQESEESRKSLYDKFKVRLAKGAVFATSLTKESLIDEATLRSNVQFLVPPVNIEDAFIKLGVVSFDIATGEEVVLCEGPLVDAVMASCAIPGVFPSVTHGERQLMDGGIVDPVPCNAARKLGADIVIAVDVTPNLDAYGTMSGTYEVAMRAADISRQRLKSLLLKEADVVISVDGSDVFWADFTRFDHCVDLGRQAAEQALPEIRRVLSAQPTVD